MCLSKKSPITNRVAIPGRPLSLYSGAISPSMKSQSILPASCTSSCLMLMIWSSRARNRSSFYRLVLLRPHRFPPIRRPNHASRFEGILKMKLQAFRASDPETLQSQLDQTARKRLSVSGLEVFHGRLRGLAIDARFTRPSLSLADRRQQPIAQWLDQIVEGRTLLRWHDDFGIHPRGDFAAIFLRDVFVRYVDKREVIWLLGRLIHQSVLRNAGDGAGDHGNCPVVEGRE